ncbi:MAG: ribose-phosphate diphosphokinase [Acidimicrobiales bacterium]
MSAFDGLLFALDDSAHLGNSTSLHLGADLAPHEEREFEWGEHKTRPLVNVRGRHVFVVATLAGDRDHSANDKLCRLLFFIGALKEASARSVTAIVPYLCYSRKDRQTKARDPVTTRYVAQLFEAIGTDRVITLDVHNLAAFQNAVRCQADHLEGTQLFVDHVRATMAGNELVVVSPDIGGVKRAERFRSRLETELSEPVGLAFTGKFRSRGVVSGPDRVQGEVSGREALVIDDMISSGTTMQRVAHMLVQQGASRVHLLATHAVFTPKAASLFSSPSITSVVVTDSVRPDRLPAEVTGRSLTVLPIGPLLAEAVARVHSGGSLVDLLHLEP